MRNVFSKIACAVVLAMSPGLSLPCPAASETAEGFVKLSLDKNKKDVLMCIPDSLIGRSVLLNTKIAGSTSSYPFVMGEVSHNGVYTVSKVDSTIVFTSGDRDFSVVEADASMENALRNSRSQAVEYVFRIKKKTDDGYSVKAGKIFDLSNKKIVDLEGLPYGPYAVTSASYQAGKSKLLGLEAYGNSVAVRTDATFDLKLRTVGLVHEFDDTFPCTMEMVTSLTLVPKNEMPHKKADPRIGTINCAYSEFDSVKGTKSESWVRRWDLSGGKEIEIYVDTLLSAAQSKAVREGFEAWNDAFEAIGMGRRIKVQDFPADSSFKAEDPLKSIVTMSGSGASVLAEMLSDGMDRILAARFFIPDNFVSSVRRRSVFTISDVDTRYQAYHLDEGAICDVLKADIIRIAGLTLGIAPNYAGSAAYTPEQLRDPEFTSRNGFTASVTDDVLFNYLTVPGDRERGVATIIDRAGEYDIHALRWIYADGKPSEDPHLFYAPLKPSSPDTRVRKYDLSNDTEAAFEAGVSHLRFVADHGAEWLVDEDIPDASYKQLFIDWLWLRGNSMAFLISSNVGAYEYNLTFEDSTVPKFVPLPKEVQKRSLVKVFDYYRSFEWLDRSPLVHIAGLNPNTSDFTRSNAFKMVNASYRFQFVVLAEKLAGSGYGVHEYLEDMERLVFKVASEGNLPYGEAFIISQYVSWLVSNAVPGGKMAFDGVSEECRVFLGRAGKKLKECRNAMKDAKDREMIDYIIAHYKQHIQ